jgi:hypothetical protein
VAKYHLLYSAEDLAKIKELTNEVSKFFIYIIIVLILQFLIGLAGALLFLDVDGVPDINDLRINDTVSLLKQLSYL